VVLAAGALNTPLVLARSTALWGAGGPPATLGRGLMFHFSDFFTLRVSARLARGSIRKTLALRDGYASEAGGLGEIQSVGVDLSTGQAMTGLRDLARATLPRPLARLVEAARPAAWVFALLLGPAPILATIAEDLPYAENRVTEAPGAGPDDAPGRIQVIYAVTPGQKAAARARRAAVRRLFAPLRVIFLTRAVAPNLGHPMGTCRMGADPATSVVDAEGRVWGCPGVYVADASVFPSSGGVGPSLTVAAHALRVGDALARDLGATTAALVRAVTVV
jgi:choline dehydrogenase-like flavoprotein